MNKLINNIGEKDFAEMMEKRGYTLIYQPSLPSFKMRPDFYCVEDETYYEIIATKQTYHARKDKIKNAQKMGIKLKVVYPDGTEFPIIKRNKIKWKNIHGKIRKAGWIKNKENNNSIIRATIYLDEKTYKAAKTLAKKEGRSLSNYLTNLVWGAKGVKERGGDVTDECVKMRLALEAIREIYAGMDGFIPETCPEGYQQRIMKQMYREAIEGLTMEKKDDRFK